MDVAKYSKTFLIILGFEFALFLGAVRYLIGPEWELLAFYLFSISVVTWYAGRRVGVMIAIASAVIGLVADIIMHDTFSHSIIPYFNEASRLAAFLFAVCILSKMKDTLKEKQEFITTDFLTGVANRRAFLESATIEINRASRFKRPFSVAFIDLDNFKTINDQFGHKTGNYLLCLLADTIKSNIRVYDKIARLGSNEYAVMLPETNQEVAAITIRRIHRTILNTMQENKWPVTFSIGVLTFNSPPRNVDDMIRHADLVMYSIKQNGKNMIKHKILDKNSMLSIDETS